MKSINAKLTAGVLIIAFIGFLSAGGFCYSISRKLLIDSNVEKTVYMASYETEVFDRWLETQKFVVDTYTEILNGLTTDAALLETCIEIDQDNEDFLAVYVAFSNGSGIFSDLWTPDPGWDATKRDWYQEALENKNDVIVVTPYYDPSTNETIITVSKYVGVYRGMDMVLAADVDVTDVLEILQSISLPDNSYAFLTDKNGLIISHHDPLYAPNGDDVNSMQEYAGYAQVFNEISVGKNYTKIKDFDGVRRYFAPAQVASADWLFFVAVPEVSMHASFDTQMLTVLVIYFFVLIVIFLCVSLLVKKTVVKPINRLVAASCQLAEGDLNIQLPPPGSDELGKLSQSFMQVVSSLNHLTGDLDKMGEEHTSGEYDYRMDPSHYSGAYKNVIEKINHMTDVYIQNFLDILEILEHVGNGNFHAHLREYPGKMAICNQSIASLQKNLYDISSEIDALAQGAIQGDLSHRADTSRFSGDWQKIMQGLNQVMEAVYIPIRAASDTLAEISTGNLSAQMAGDFQGDFSLIKNTLNNTASAISSYVQDISNVLSELSQNNFDLQMTGDYPGDFVAIKNSINMIITKFNSIMHEIIIAMDQVATGAKQVSSTSMVLAEDAVKQANIVTDLNEFVVSIQQKAQSNAGKAQTAETISQRSKENADTGSKEMKKMIQSMDEIKEAANSIAIIMKVINDIAFQTNLLALNAAVEASRAGQYGKGFAVVAEEVRTLSSKSTEAAKQTQQLIENTIHKVNGGTEIALSTSQSLQLIIDDISAISSQIADIAQSSSEQAASVASIVDSIQNISEVAQNNTSVSEESASTAQQLSAQSEVLNDSLGVFKLQKLHPGS